MRNGKIKDIIFSKGVSPDGDLDPAWRPKEALLRSACADPAKSSGNPQWRNPAHGGAGNSAIKRIKQNEPLSCLTHLVGAGLAIAGLVLLIVFAALYGTAWHIVGFSVFGAAAILLYSTSALYHFLCQTNKAKKLFQRLDYAMIYFFIAATYTPVCFILKDRGLGWTLFGIIWALAITGIVLRSTGITIRKWLPLVIYLAMGWMGATALFSLLQFLPRQAAWWLLAGGISYTIGAIFFILDNFIPRMRWFGMHEVFHLFIIAGSFSHFWFMFRYVMYA